jgi:RimJ/RimL family protein N-acetyltransferase
VQPDWPIETDRLLIRPYIEDDLDGLYALQSDPEVVRYLYNEPRTRAETREQLERKMQSRVEKEDDWLSAAVTLEGTFVGDVAFHWESEEHKTAEVGYMIDPRYQGRGFATEAIRPLVDWAFAEGFHRVIGRIEARNAASGRVLEKLGMRKEAHFVENEWVKGEWQSEIVYAILDREWQR